MNRRALLLTTILPALLTLGVVAGEGPVSPAASEDWSSALSGGGDEADTGVLGMTSGDLDTYVTAQGGAGEADPEPEESFTRNRRRFVMREFKFGADWDCDPTALPAFIEQYKLRTEKDAMTPLPRRPLTFDSPDLFDWPFVYMTSHNGFALSDAEIAGLRRYLSRGGFLYCDDCQGSPGQCYLSLRRELKRVFPDNDGMKPFNLETPNFGMLLHQKYSWDGVNEAGLPMGLKTKPFECLAIDGHMVAILSTPDIGCGWEVASPPTPSNPLGMGMHNLDNFAPMRENSYEMGVNIVFYAMSH